MSGKQERGRSAARTRKPLDTAGLERLALRYVERFATSRARLAAYLERKLREHGWAEDRPPDVALLAERMAALGYVDDRSFASARASSLVRCGYGPRRIALALKAAGIGEADGAAARASAESSEWQSALALARRRRIGPFAVTEPDREARNKAFALLIRAGHRSDVVRKIVAARPGDVLEEDE